MAQQINRKEYERPKTIPWGHDFFDRTAVDGHSLPCLLGNLVFDIAILTFLTAPTVKIP